MASQRELAERLCDAALDLTPAERKAFLDRACNDDPELRQDVEALLAEDAEAGSFLEPPTLQDLTIDSVSTPRTVIGPYQLLELIGEGGMGEVWVAEQKQPVRRRVAIKLIKAGMDTREVVARFQSERQALALMDHPAIAKVFDAGSTSEGRPYFVMEYVAGVPITSYCDKHRLTVRQRMELFIHVCEGVQHAHQKAIIHRDLKPSNILVAEIDGRPMPRIIDFGVAKATSQKLTAETMYTRIGTMVGTLGYMSPEQADPIREDIDTRTDIYSLGAVLYELLTGALPLDLQTLPFDQALRRLRDQDAPRPSTKITALGNDSTIAAKNRASDPPTLVRQLRGDPDAIALKALEKDRVRRYASASGLAADIGRYLRNEPVTAHPPSTTYRVRKYIRRHSLGVSVAAAVVLLLVGFAIAQSIELRRITEERDRTARERDRTARERDRADRVTQFMTNMFRVSSPSEARGNTVTAREILDKASNEIDTGLKNDPELQARMMYTMAETYDGLGLLSRAEPLLERAIEIQRRVLGSHNAETLRSMSHLAEILGLEDRVDAAERIQRETLDAQRQVLGPEDPDTLWSMVNLAAILHWGQHYAEAEKLEREALEIRRRTLGPEHPDTIFVMSLLADTLQDLGKFSEAEKLAHEVVNTQRRDLGPDHPDTLGSMKILAEILNDEHRYSESVTIARQVLEIQRRILGSQNLDTAGTMGVLEDSLAKEGLYNEAEKLAREDELGTKNFRGPESPEALSVMSDLAWILHQEGHLAEAEALNREALEKVSKIAGPEELKSAAISYLALNLSRQGHYTDAEKLYREAIEIAAKTNQQNVAAQAWYSFASGAALAEHHNDALDYLAHAVDNGFGRPDWIAADPNLESLHGDPRFDALIAKERQNPNARRH